MATTMSDSGNVAACGREALGVAGIPGILDEATLSHLVDVEFARARRYEHPFSLLRVSVRSDDPRALHVVAGALRLHTRWADSVGGHGARALLVVLRDTPAEAARAAAAKISAALDSELSPEVAGGVDLEFAAWRKGDDRERLLARLARLDRDS